MPKEKKNTTGFPPENKYLFTLDLHLLISFTKYNCIAPLCYLRLLKGALLGFHGEEFGRKT